MANDSSTGGYLDPAASPAPLQGQDFDRFMQQVVVNITGIAGQFVRPRWQPEPPNAPPNSTDWAAIGAIDFNADTFPSVSHVDTDSGGRDVLFEQEEVAMLVSFFGPNAVRNAAVFRDGLKIAQNREVLASADIAVIDTGRITAVPALMHERWQYRVDLPFNLRRAIRRFYPVLNILSATGSIITDNDPQLMEPINVTP